MGPAYGAYRDGRLTLDDFAGVRQSERWGTAVYQRSQRDVLANSTLGRRPIYGSTPRTESLELDDLSPAAALDRIRDESQEYLYLYDPSGRQVFIGRGAPDRVALPHVLLSTDPANPIRPRLADYWIVHNHPLEAGRTSYPPSPLDVARLAENDMTGITIASGPSEYRLNRPPGGWYFRTEQEVNEAVAIAETNLGYRTYSPAQIAADERLHDILSELERLGFLEYVRTSAAGRA
jgi:hypothetical protein